MEREREGWRGREREREGTEEMEREECSETPLMLLTSARSLLHHASALLVALALIYVLQRDGKTRRPVAPDLSCHQSVKPPLYLPLSVARPTHQL